MNSSSKPQILTIKISSVHMSVCLPKAEKIMAVGIGSFIELEHDFPYYLLDTQIEYSKIGMVFL